MITKRFDSYTQAQDKKFTGIAQIRDYEDPAILRVIYMQKGKWHRTDGPAEYYIFASTGNPVLNDPKRVTKFWLDDQSYSRENFWNDNRTLASRVKMTEKAINDY